MLLSDMTTLTCSAHAPSLPLSLHPAQSNVKAYYLQFEEAESQSQIESRILEYQQRARMVSKCCEVSCVPQQVFFAV